MSSPTLATGRRTAVGSAILKSIDAIAEVDKAVAPSQTEDSAPGSAPAPVPKGAYAPDIIVLLTDGASNAGPDPTEAAQQAADRGIRVYTIGFGTDDPGAAEPALRAAVHRRRAGRRRPRQRWRWLRRRWGRRWRRDGLPPRRSTRRR